MIIKFDNKNITKKLGNKGKYLMLMRQNGFQVPDGFILDSDCYDEIIKSYGIHESIQQILKEAVNTKTVDSTRTADSVKAADNTRSADSTETADNTRTAQISKKIMQLFDGVKMDNSIISLLEENIDPEKKYAVRSSGTSEDLDNYSFAGQYESFLNVQGIDNIIKAIIDCYKSMFSEVTLTYLANHSIPMEDLKMSVVIQEMIASEYSGIAFTVNPITGNDKEFLVEVAEGLGDIIVNGKVKPEQYFYNWYEERYHYEQSNGLLDKEMLNSMMKTFLDIQIFFGYPCDIEFAIVKGELYILQARAITRIKYSGIKDIWTTADFKDGGVSASVCTPFMWSLYEYVWEYSLRKFLIESKILKPRECDGKLGEMFYGRPYWNLSVVKLAMSKVPGYKEREFDSDFGVKITYEGDGTTTGITVSSLWGIIKMVIAQKRILKERNQNVERYKVELLKKYEDYRKSYRVSTDEKQFEQEWYQLTQVDYLQSETTYFWQIFINTIHQSLYKDGLLKYINNSEYIGLLSGIDQISHLLPFYDMWETSRRISKDEKAFSYWRNTPLEQIREELGNGSYYLDEVSKFIETYGYHSEKELDVTYPCYYEDTLTVIKMFRDSVLLDDSCSPDDDKKRQRDEYERQLRTIQNQLSARKFRKLETKVTNMRRMLWWREEFRDVSTRFYYIIRIYTLRLADYYVKNGVLERVEDIWMLKVGQLWDYIDGKLTTEELQEIIAKSKSYFNSFRNYMSDNEIGSIFDLKTKEAQTKDGIYGLGCNNGVVTATARVIENLGQIDRLQQGDILVTRFTDTGWTCKFAMLSGIVTEYGGILCHSAIVSREYGIPCIVSVHDVMNKIKDGCSIKIDGTTGEVKIMKEE